MSRKIVISINPEHVENIINGSKKFEYRTKAAKSNVKKIFIYETVPVKKIVAGAASLMMISVPIIVFIISQAQVVETMATSGIK